MPTPFERVLELYPGRREIEELKCVNNIEWEEELPYYSRDIKFPRLMPGVTRKIFKIGKEFGIIDLRNATESCDLCEAYLPLPEKIQAKPNGEVVTLTNNIFCSCARTYMLRDFGIGINCVPYFMPDGKISACAQSAIKIVVKHFANEFDSSNFTMPQIQKLAAGDPYGSGGLYSSQVARALSNIGGMVFLYQGKKHEDRVSGRTTGREGYMDSPVLHAYIESELPVYLVFNTSDLWWWRESTEHDFHSLVGIGHSLDENGNLDFFLVHDVSDSPYRPLSAKIVDECLYESVVVLPKGVNVRFENAFTAMLNSASLMDEFVKQKVTPPIDFKKMLQDDKIVFRTMLVTSTKIKEWYTDQTNFYGVRAITKKIYADAELPPYVWLFELKDKDRRDNINFAQVLINATEGAPKLSLINFPGGALKYRDGLEIVYVGGEEETPADAGPGDPGLRKNAIQEKWSNL